MKNLLFIISILVLTSCTPETSEVSTNYVLPKELSDCSFYMMSGTNGNYITVVRCPNSQTSVRTSGKYPKTAITVESKQESIQEKINSLEKQLNELKALRD